jgi:hypothetical protein
MPQKSKDLKSRKTVKIFESRIEVSTRPILFIRKPAAVGTTPPRKRK